MPHAMQAANRHARTDTAASDTQSRVTTCETFTVRALSQLFGSTQRKLGKAMPQLRHSRVMSAPTAQRLHDILPEEQ